MHEYIVLSHYPGRPEIPYVDDIDVRRIAAESHERALLKFLEQIEGVNIDDNDDVVGPWCIEHFDYHKMVGKVLLAGFEGETVYYAIETDELPVVGDGWVDEAPSYANEGRQPR